GAAVGTRGPRRRPWAAPRPPARASGTPEAMTAPCQTRAGPPATGRPAARRPARAAGRRVRAPTGGNGTITTGTEHRPPRPDRAGAGRMASAEHARLGPHTGHRPATSPRPPRRPAVPRHRLDSRPPGGCVAAWPGFAGWPGPPSPPANPTGPVTRQDGRRHPDDSPISDARGRGDLAGASGTGETRMHSLTSSSNGQGRRGQAVTDVAVRPAERIPEPVGTPVKRPARADRIFQVVMLVILAAAVVVRFSARQDLWLDEAQSVAIARLPLTGHGPTMFTGLRQDGSPPFYYLFLHFWIHAFGAGNVAVRTLSALM